MKTTRLEAFSDGVIAIIITIMVLELKVPHGQELEALRPLLAPFLSYLLSFLYVGIYWNNHHHLIHSARRVDGRVLWTNLHLLFWLSLFPVTTGWVGETHGAPTPTAVYGGVLFMAGLAYTLLQNAILRLEGAGSRLATSLGRDYKGKVSVLAYLAAVPLAFWLPLASNALYVLVAAMWFIPDRRLAHAEEERRSS